MGDCKHPSQERLATALLDILRHRTVGRREHPEHAELQINCRAYAVSSNPAICIAVLRADAHGI